MRTCESALHVTQADKPIAYRKHSAKTDNGTTITAEYIDKLLNEEAKKVKGVDEGNLETARKYMSQQAHGSQLTDFLTSDLMSHLDDEAAPGRPKVKGKL